MSKEVAKKLAQEAKAAKYAYSIGGKPVSEFKFFVSLRREMSGKKSKKVFYWTDEKVILLMKAFGIKITKEEMAKIKQQSI